MTREDIARVQSPAVGTGGDTLDAAVVPKLAWLTRRRVIVGLIVWLAAFALGSIDLANPFSTGAPTSATHVWHVMYLHGLLIALVGLMALAALDVFETACSKHVRTGIVLGVIGAAVLTAIGGIFDRAIPGDEAAMWTQIVGFFFLDEILILLIVGLWQGWRARTPSSRTLPYFASFLAAFSMLMAAVLGHIAGWILEYHTTPWVVIGNWANWDGVSYSDLQSNLTDAHMQIMVVGAMALVLSVGLYRFGYREVGGVLRNISGFGVAMAAAGLFWLTGWMTATGVTGWAPGLWFTSAGGTNGIKAHYVIEGIVMVGGLIALWPLVLHLMAKSRSWADNALPVAAAWAWTGIIVGIVVAGYYIRLNETFYGDHSPQAPGAATDSTFTSVHMDIGLFVFPALFTILLLADRLVARRYKGNIGWTAIAAVSMLLIGGGVWVFVNPTATFGAGYALSTVGLALLGVSITVTMVYGLARDGQLRLVSHLPHRHHVDSHAA